LFVKKGVLLYPIKQAICFRKLVESLNSRQTIVRQKRLIFPSYFTGIEQTIHKKIDCGSKQFVKHLIKYLSDISQAISLQKCIQIAVIL
jgi:hypothetical protein